LKGRGESIAVAFTRPENPPRGNQFVHERNHEEEVRLLWVAEELAELLALGRDLPQRAGTNIEVLNGAVSDLKEEVAESVDKPDRIRRRKERRPMLKKLLPLPVVMVE